MSLDIIKRLVDRRISELEEIKNGNMTKANEKIVEKEEYERKLIINKSQLDDLNLYQQRTIDELIFLKREKQQLESYEKIEIGTL